MKKVLTYILAALCLTPLFASCERVVMTEGKVEEAECVVDIPFGYKAYDEVNITTKSTLDIVPESRVQNLFVFVFVNGKRYYAHFFDLNNRVEPAALATTDDNCWTVDQKNDEEDVATHGTIRIKAPTLSGGKLYIVANIDADMVNISPERLNTITTENELLQMTAQLNQLITSRNGFFPMVSFNDGVTIDATGITVPGGKAILERLDAKIEVSVRIATNYTSEYTRDGVTTVQTLKSFTPESWHVINLPKGCSVVPQDAQSSSTSKSAYFSTEPISFESRVNAVNFVSNGQTYTSTLDKFSFYMLENKQTPTTSVAGDYHKRDICVKDPNTGEYILTAEGEKQWVYAPDCATYLVIKGEIMMNVDISSEAKQQQLAGDVTYYVHLGDFAADRDNYTILRNTNYKYTITIKGVEKIDLEVSTSNLNGVGPTSPDFKEEESGATGDLYYAKESIRTFDAHYGQQVCRFDAGHIDPDVATWYVKTPFGREGVPVKVGDVEVPSGLDYKWVHFVVNRVDASGSYSQTCMPWPGDPNDGEADHGVYTNSHRITTYGVEHGLCEDDVMDVLEFTKYIKTQKRNLDAGEVHDFRKEFDIDWFNWYKRNNPGSTITEAQARADLDGVWYRNRIYVTVFVDEFYYDKDPISGIASQDLWKKFVNVPNRLMHILCDSQASFDEESTSTGSVLTIRQRSIQTPYSINSDCMTAWGCEFTDELADSHLFFWGNESMSGVGNAPGNLGNTSQSNGLFNTARLLSLISGSTISTRYWRDYINLDWKEGDLGTNGSPIYMLKSGRQAHRYAAIVRNRDNNGDGIINANELKWYTASLLQLEYLFIGEQGLHKDACIYPPKYEANNLNFAGTPYARADRWRCHVISSTKTPKIETNGFTLTNHPIIVWAEESTSTSVYGQDIYWANRAPFNTRCVRNLGFGTITANDLINESAQVPTPLITVEENTDGTCRFNARNLNDKSKRFYTSVELEPYDEDSEMARLYHGFETGEEIEITRFNRYNEFKPFLSEGNTFCPKGYRTPNMRELTMMYLLKRDLLKSRGVCSSYYSLGVFGSLTDTSAESKDKSSWSYNGGDITLSKWNEETGNKYYIRCVRDYTP